MPFNIDAFKQNLSDFGYLDNNSFDVIISTPQILFNSTMNVQGTPTSIQKIAKNLKLRIDQVRAPGISLITSDINKFGLGNTQKMPYNSQIQEISFSMLVDHYGEIWQYWYNWIRGIHEFSGSDGDAGAFYNSLPSYETEYKRNYSTVVQIIVYDHFGNAIQKMNLYEAYPTAIREVPMAWGDPNLMKLNISLAYTEFTIFSTGIQKNPVGASPKQMSSFERTRTGVGSTL